jgi:hypothetical protein
MDWTGLEWNGMEWNGMEWKMDCNKKVGAKSSIEKCYLSDGEDSV